MKRSRLRVGRKLTAAELERLGNFSDDELEIPADATWDQVQEVLDYVVSGDQFERLLDEALPLIDVSDEVVREHPHVHHDKATREVWRAMEEIASHKDVLWSHKEPATRIATKPGPHWREVKGGSASPGRFPL